LQKRFPRPFDVDAEFSLLDQLKAEQMPEAIRSAFPESRPPSQQSEDLTTTITWRVGKLITGPIERAAGLVPGLVPALKHKLGR
jgi:hypothetical protein